MKASTAPPSGSATSRPWLQRRGRRRLERVPEWLAAYLAFVAAFSAILAVLPVLRRPLHWPRVAVEVRLDHGDPNVAYAIALALLAAACRRRLRAA